METTKTIQKFIVDAERYGLAVDKQELPGGQMFIVIQESNEHHHGWLQIIATPSSKGVYSHAARAAWTPAGVVRKMTLQRARILLSIWGEA